MELDCVEDQKESSSSASSSIDRTTAAGREEQMQVPADDHQKDSSSALSSLSIGGTIAASHQDQMQVPVVAVTPRTGWRAVADRQALKGNGATSDFAQLELVMAYYSEKKEEASDDSVIDAEVTMVMEDRTRRSELAQQLWAQADSERMAGKVVSWPRYVKRHFVALKPRGLLGVSSERVVPSERVLRGLTR